MKVGSKEEGREDTIHPPRYARHKSLSRGCRFSHWVSHSSQNTSHRTLTANDRWFRTRGDEKKKRLNLQNVCAGQGADVFWLLTGLCVQATIHCKDQAKWTCFFWFFFWFLSLFFCIVTRSVKYEASDRLRGMVRQSEIDNWMIAKAQNGRRGQLLKLPAEWTAYRWIGPCGIRILSENKACSL